MSRCRRSQSLQQQQLFFAVEHHMGDMVGSLISGSVVSWNWEVTGSERIFFYATNGTWQSKSVWANLMSTQKVAKFAATSNFNDMHRICWEFELQCYAQKLSQQKWGVVIPSLLFLFYHLQRTWHKYMALFDPLYWRY